MGRLLHPTSAKVVCHIAQSRSARRTLFEGEGRDDAELIGCWIRPMKQENGVAPSPHYS